MPENDPCFEIMLKNWTHLMNPLRQKFKNEVFKRDGFKCVFCDETQNLDAHHITDRHEIPNGGYVKENGITVCQVHHLECEQYHINDGKSWAKDKHPNDLYNIIQSTKELAIQKSIESGL